MNSKHDVANFHFDLAIETEKEPFSESARQERTGSKSCEESHDVMRSPNSYGVLSNYALSCSSQLPAPLILLLYIFIFIVLSFLII